MYKQAQDVPAFMKEDNEFMPDFMKEKSAPTQSFTMPEQAFTSSGFQEVKDMQQAIVNFSNTLAAHPVMAKGEDNGAQERDRVGGKEFLGGSLSFGNFLVSQYVNNPDVVGQEFVNVDVAEPIRSQSAKPNVNLKSIVNTMGIVGSAGSHNKPDGVWQSRTNNALKQIYAVGSGLFGFARDMGITIKGFTEKQLNGLKTLIPKSYTEIKDKAALAKEITPYITALTALYKQFESAVLEHPQLKELIEQNKPLVDHSGQAKVALTKDEQALIDTNRGANIPGVVINGKAVRLADIEGPTAFTNFLKSANVDVSRTGEAQKQLTKIRNMLGTEGPGF